MTSLKLEDIKVGDLILVEYTSGYRIYLVLKTYGLINPITCYFTLKLLKNIDKNLESPFRLSKLHEPGTIGEWNLACVPVTKYTKLQKLLYD